MALKVENKRGGDPGSEVELGNRPEYLIPELGPISGDFVVLLNGSDALGCAIFYGSDRSYNMQW